MDEKGIEVFLAIAMTHNFMKAAGILNLTQSTVSHRLKTLEDEWGSLLILRHRGRKEVTLTPDGERFLPLALRWRRLHEQIEYTKNISSSLTTLSAGGLDSVKDFILLPFLAAFRTRFSNVQLQLYTGSSTDMYELVSRRQIDAAFVQFDLQSTLVTAEPFCREKLVILYNRYEYPHISTELLDPRNELMINWGTAFTRWHDHIWGSAHRAGTICDTLFELRGLLQKPADWAFIPMSSTRWFLRNPDLAVAFLDPPPPDRIILLISPMNPKLPTLNAVNHFKNILKNQEIQKQLSGLVDFPKI